MNELEKERQYISEELNKVSDDLSKDARRKMEQEGYVDPIVIVIYVDGRKEFLYPRFKTDVERAEAFDEMNQFIVNTDAAGVVVLVDTELAQIDRGRVDAILVQKRSRNVREFRAFTYSRGESGKFVAWDRELGPAKIIRDTIITAFDDVT